MMDALDARDAHAERSEEASVSMGLLPALLVGIVLFAIATIAHAELYKWTDGSGVVHYSDHLPPDAVDRAHEQLNRQGIPVRKTEKAAPPQSRTSSAAEQERDRTLARERQATERRDRALLDSYSSTAEIDLARNRALSTINAQIASASSYVAEMTKRRDELLAKKASYAPHPAPDSIVRELSSIDAELARQQAFIAGRRKEAATITARYDADHLRYEQLTKSPSSSSAASVAAGTALSALSQASAPRN